MRFSSLITNAMILDFCQNLIFSWITWQDELPWSWQEIQEIPYLGKKWKNLRSWQEIEEFQILARNEQIHALGKKF